MPVGANEAFSRVLIDKALEASGWNLLDPHQVRFELNSVTGRADYVLGGQHGPLSVLEAKREELDPYDAKDQAHDAASGFRPGFRASNPRLPVTQAGRVAGGFGEQALADALVGNRRVRAARRRPGLALPLPAGDNLKTTLDQALRRAPTNSSAF